MKIKGINPFERNVEKIVLGTVAAAFLVVLALQFVRQPNMITVDGKTVPPQDAYRELEQRAQALTSQMKSVEPPPPPDRGNVDLLAGFKEAMEGDVAPSRTIAWNPPGVDVGVKDGGGAPSALGAKVAEVVPPAPKGPIANVTAAAIDPGEVAESPELAAIAPKQQPYDMEAVTVEAVFDGTALRAAFMADPDGGGASPMPSTWWQESVQILGSRLEREEQAPTGEWTNATMVGGMPGREDFAARAEGEEVARKAEVDAIAAEAGAAAEQARRPEYYRTIAGPAWIAPREAWDAMQTGGSKSQVDRLLASKADKEGQLADLEEQLKNATDEKAPPRGGGGDGGGGGKGRGGGGAGQQGKENPPPTDTKKTKPQIERQIKTLKDQIARIEKELKDLGYQAPTTAAPGVVAKAKALLDDPAVRVWAHDLTAQPGKMYRYRLRVVVNNPAFDRAAFISAEQAQFAATPVLYSAPSEWTAPVSLDGAECFFIVGASEGGEGPLGGTRATAEIYKFYYGYWRQGKVNLEPGDLLASTAKLPELFSYDMAMLGQTPTDPNTAPEGGRGREAVGTGEEAAAPTPPGQEPLARDLPIVIDAVLLDVARIPGGLDADSNRLAGSVTPNQALLRDGTGRIVTRIPEQDRVSVLYERVAKSAREGLNQGAPPPPKAQDKDEPGQKREEDGPKPPGDKGGGGAGPGGGG